MVEIPEGYEWINGWTFEIGGNTDEDGWEYGENFKEHNTFGKNDTNKYIRRRKWIRYCKLIHQ